MIVRFQTTPKPQGPRLPEVRDLQVGDVFKWKFDHATPHKLLGAVDPDGFTVDAYLVTRKSGDCVQALHLRDGYSPVGSPEFHTDEHITIKVIPPEKVVLTITE